MTRGSGRDTTRSWRSCPYWRNALVFGSSLRLGLGVVLDPVVCRATCIGGEEPRVMDVAQLFCNLGAPFGLASGVLALL